MPWMESFNLQGCECCIQDTLALCHMRRSAEGRLYTGWMRPNRSDPLLQLALYAPDSCGGLPAEGRLFDLAPPLYAADSNCCLTIRVVPEPLYLAGGALLLAALCVLYPRFGLAALLCSGTAGFGAWKWAPSRCIELAHLVDH